MTLGHTVDFLRARARRLRDIAGTARTAISDPLRKQADEAEARADDLERIAPRSSPKGNGVTEKIATPLPTEECDI